MKRLVLFALPFIVLGCKPSTDSPPAVAPGGPGPVATLDETGPHAAGKKVFNTQGCARCHTMGGSAPKGGKGGKMQGPDLSKVAEDPVHTAEWLGDFIRDPKSKLPNSRMPPFQAKINDEDFKALIAYLLTLK